MEKRILHLTLKKKWFDLIVNQQKHFEYREIKEYWTRRLLDTPFDAKVFDEIYFTNGYGKDKPFMRVKWVATHKLKYAGKLHYAIELGKILEIKDWNGGKK